MENDVLKMAVQLATALISRSDSLGKDDLVPLVEKLYFQLHEIGKNEPAPYKLSNQYDNVDEAPSSTSRSFAASPSPSVSSASTFNASDWLESLPEVTSWAAAEARKRNHYVDKGWVGVSDTHIVCLLDGKAVRLLTTHLKRNYKNMPHVATPEAYRSHFMLPPDYPMGSPQFQALKSNSIHKANQDRLAGEAHRPDDIQEKIDAALANSGMNLAKQVNAETRPGLFEHDIICLQCSAKVQDLASHLRAEHKMSLLKYISVFKISSRYPAAVAPVGIAGARARADELLAVNKIAPAKMVNPKSWPGVAANFIVCLEDGAQVVDLGSHLAKKHRMSIDAYRTKYGLPKDFPAVAVDAAGLVETPAPRKVGRPAKVESQTIKTRKGSSEVQVVRRKTASKAAIAAKAKTASRKGKLGLALD